MQELTEYEEQSLRSIGYIFDHNEWVGKKRDDTGWSNVRKENSQYVIRGAGFIDGRKQEFSKVYDSIEDILDGQESIRRTNNA